MRPPTPPSEPGTRSPTAWAIRSSGQPAMMNHPMRRVAMIACSTSGSGATDRTAGLVLPTCIPTRYHSGMTIQIAVRLPDDIVDYVDQQVAAGAAASRAAVVARALDRDRRRHV